MIMLDTSFLIPSLRTGTPQSGRVDGWLSSEETLNVSAIVWGELLCGPLTADQLLLASDLFPEPETLIAADATLAARLFNATGRRRGALADCMIAATAIRLNAFFATENTRDFQRFVGLGLRLIE